MAKKKVRSSNALLPPKEITVKSRAYGVHTRAARGSKTPVAINESLKANVAKTALINSTAKRVHDLLNMFSRGFKEAMLWQAMLSRMRKATSDSTIDLLLTLKGIELNSKYPLDRFVRLFELVVEWRKKSCRIALRNLMPPRIKSNDTEYLYELYLLVIGKGPKHDGWISGRTEWMEKGKPAGEAVFSFDVPKKITHYVLCLHCMTGKDGKETGTLASRGMRIIGAGHI